MEISDDKIQEVVQYVKESYQKDILNDNCNSYRALSVLILLGIITPSDVDQWKYEVRVTGE